MELGIKTHRKLGLSPTYGQPKSAGNRSDQSRFYPPQKNNERKNFLILKLKNWFKYHHKSNQGLSFDTITRTFLSRVPIPLNQVYI